jgi:hypothetical protein
MKIKIVGTKNKINEAVRKILPNVDGGYTYDVLGYRLGKELGKGDFGIVHSIISNKSRKEYALKVVSKLSDGYSREKRNYENVMDFVNDQEKIKNPQKIANFEIMHSLVSDYLPKIYAVEEHPKTGDLYIVMEKLIPLSDKESKEWMTTTSGLAYLQRKTMSSIPKKGQKDYAGLLGDMIIDTQGSSLIFDEEKARTIVDLISKSPEHQIIKTNRQKYEDYITKGSDDSRNAKEYINFVKTFNKKKIDAGDPAVIDKKILSNIVLLWEESPEARRTINAIIDVIVSAYDDGQSTDISTDPEMMAYLLDALFDVLFAQKNPFQYKKSGVRSALYQGYGQTSDIFKINWKDEGIEPNPINQKYVPKKPRQRTAPVPYAGDKFTQDDEGRNIIPKSMQLKDLIEKFKDTPIGQKFAFNPIMNAVEELAEDWDIEIVDLHNANVMKRANGQVVFVDIGLFVTKQRPVTQKPPPSPPIPSSSPNNNPWQSGGILKKSGGEPWQSGRGLYESKSRKIKIKILNKLKK